MTNQNDENGKLRVQEHNARVRAFQILCALGAVAEAPLSQAEIEARFEDLFVLPQPQDGKQPEVVHLSEDSETQPVSFEEYRASCARAFETQCSFAETDALIERYATGWKVSRMSLVDRTVIRMAIYEGFIARTVPVSVALSEAVLIAKEFGGAESGRFVNGVLARIARAQEQ